MFADLRAKYEEMRELRRTDDGSYDPLPRMRSLAARFPGALREIDTLTLDEIEHRIEALTNAERDPSHAMPWMKAQSRFHELVRDALATTRERNWLDAVYVRLAGELATTPDEVKALVFSPSSREQA